jgi:hypothetical protein
MLAVFLQRRYCEVAWMCGQGAAAQPNRSNGLAGRQADRAAGCETPTLFIEFLAYSEKTTGTSDRRADRNSAVSMILN